MYKHLATALLLFFTFPIFSQTANYCTITDVNTQKQMRLEYSVSSKEQGNVFETSYLILDKNNFPFKAVTVTNNTSEHKIYMSVRELTTGKEELNYPYKYSEFAGLLMNELYDTVSVLNKPYNYLYLLAFKNEKKQNAELFFISHLENYTIQFGTVSDEKMKQNKSYLQQVNEYRKLLKEQEEKKKEEEALNRKIDSLVQIRIDQKLGEITTPVKDNNNNNSKIEPPKPPIPLSFREKHPEFEPSEFVISLLNEASNFFTSYKKDSVKLYQIKNAIINDIKSNNPALLNNLNRELSYTAKGISSEKEHGNYTWLHNKEYDYYGEIEQNIKHGYGLQLFADKNFYLGNFANDYLTTGYARLNGTVTGDYFGGFTNFKNTGYGELKNNPQALSVGTFKNSVLQNGFIRQTTPNGTQYTKVVNGNNEGEDNQNGEYFFEQIAKLKK
ncbi:MAG TPA: hypothetical protein PLM55_01185 [Chitinophagales bacterium]|nr:hypothetical protein [Chitinophagales bacterium]